MSTPFNLEGMECYPSCNDSGLKGYGPRQDARHGQDSREREECNEGRVLK